MVKNCDRGLENAARGRGQHFIPRSQIFTEFYRVQMGLFTQLLSFNRLARPLLTICKKSWQRTSNSDSRQRKMY